MISIRFARLFLGTMTMAALLGALACSHDSPDQISQHMAQRNLELDELSSQAGNPGLAPGHRMEAPGGHAGSFQAYTAWLKSGDEQ